MKIMLKRYLAIFITVIMLFGLSPASRFGITDLGVNVFAATVDSSGEFGDGFTWEFTRETGELVIRGIGEMYDWSNREAPWYDFKSYIYSVIIEEGITSVGNYSFYTYYNLETVSMPETITRIGVGAFDSCRKLQSIYIPDSVTYLGESAFSDCKMLSRVDIPDGVTYLGARAFSDCEMLQSIDIPDGVTEISESLFSGCYELEYINLGNGITSIGWEAFKNCKSLKELEGEENALSIGASAFFNCESIETIDLNENLAYLDYDTFRGCRSLKSVFLPANVSLVSDIVDNSIFYDCDSLEGFTVDPDNANYCSDEYGVLYNKNKTTLIQYPVGNDRTSYTVVSTTTKISDYAFRNGKSLKEVILPKGLKHIGVATFENCENLKGIELPDSLNVLDVGAFKSCSSLESIVIPKNVTFLGDAFRYCTSLKSAVLLCDKLETLANGTFEECTALEEVVLSDGINKIKQEAFYYCRALKTLTLSNSVKVIEEDAFLNCDNIKDIYFYGTESEWNAITLADGNKYIRYATIQMHFLGCEHEYDEIVVEPTCIEAGYSESVCKLCGYSYRENHTDVLGHDLGEWIITREPTEKVNGLKVRYCSRCDYNENATIDKILLPLFRGSRETALAGQTAEVTVWIDDNIGIISAHLMVSYDSDILELIEVRDEKLLENGTMVTGNDLTAIPYNVIIYDAVAEENCTDDGALVTFVFKISEGAPEGTTKITIDYYADSTFDKDLNNVKFDTENGRIWIMLSRMPGDANNDKEVNLKDVVFIERFLVGGYDIEINELNADVNEDGKVDLKDCVLIKRYLADWDVVLL